MITGSNNDVGNISEILTSISVPEEFKQQIIKRKSVEGIGDVLRESLKVPKKYTDEKKANYAFLNAILAMSGKNNISLSAAKEPTVLFPIIVPDSYYSEKRKERDLQKQILYNLFPHTKKLEEEILSNIFKQLLGDKSVVEQIEEEKNFRNSIFNALFTFVPTVDIAKDEEQEDSKETSRFKIEIEYHKAKPFDKFDITVLGEFEVDDIAEVNGKLYKASLGSKFSSMIYKEFDEYQQWYAGDSSYLSIFIPTPMPPEEPCITADQWFEQGMTTWGGVMYRRWDDKPCDTVVYPGL